MTPWIEQSNTMSIERMQNNSDDQRRALEREWKETGDPVAGEQYLMMKLRAGELEQKDIDLLALLGEQAAEGIASIEVPGDHVTWALEIIERMPEARDRIFVATLNEACETLDNPDHPEDLDLMKEITSHMNYVFANDAYSNADNWLTISRATEIGREHWATYDGAEFERYECNTLEEFIKTVDDMDLLYRFPSDKKGIKQALGYLFLAKHSFFDTDEAEFREKIQTGLLSYLKNEADPIYDSVHEKEIPRLFVDQPLNLDKD